MHSILVYSVVKISISRTAYISTPGICGSSVVTWKINIMGK